MEPAFHQAAGGRHGAELLPPLPIAAPQPERVPVPRDLVVPLHDLGDLAAEAVGGGGVHLADLALPLPAAGAGPEELGLEPLEARRAERLELELLEHVLRRVLQVPELPQPQRDEVVGHHPVLGGPERGADAPELGPQLVEIGVVDGARLGRGPERPQQRRGQAPGPEREVVEEAPQVLDEPRLAGRRHGVRSELELRARG